MAKNISFTIKFWRQNGPKDQGHFDTHEMHDIPDDTSFLEMLDILNEELTLHQWYASRTYRAWSHHMSALYASLQRW